ncbi:BQ5605_C049g12435 [Microbotryum silenes-dioicae]|uniref:BQ5605_C049g12435 protein n=1 Tax=Microbotryum silenes-dioicae TaxID=796604 RepID=A0A2X0PHW7_9BASI|nr:BQ5605_C049g12435 [Microbotryum silenes-dioicae]
MAPSTTTAPAVPATRTDLVLIPLAGSTFGFVSGVLTSSQLASKQFLAENAHRLPTTVQGWYFYQKTKNYRVLYSGVIGGLRTGARLGLWTASFVGFEYLIQTRLLQPVLSSPNLIASESIREQARAIKTRWLSATIAGVSIAWVAGRIYRLSRYAAPRRFLLGASLGLVSGATYDLRDWLKTRLPPPTNT